MSTEKLTITLTDARPVTIVKADWPVVASAKDWDNQYESQANRTWKLFVRQHEDGRAIVYGVYDTSWGGEDSRRAGALVPADGDIIGAIKSVGEYLDFDRNLVDQCIADLPAEELQ